MENDYAQDEEEREVREYFSKLDMEATEAMTGGTKVIVEKEGQLIVYEVLAELGRVEPLLLGITPGEAGTEPVLKLSSRVPKKACPICGEEQSKLSRHMKRLHPGVEVTPLPRSPSKKTMQCSICKKQVSRKNIKRHVKTHNCEKSESFTRRNVWVPVERTLSPQMTDVMRRLRDDVRLTVLGDDLIIQVLQKYLIKNLHIRHAAEFVRAAARRLGLLLNRCRLYFKKDDMTMDEVISVKNYSALEEIGKDWSENFKKPSNLMRMGEDLAKLRASKFRNATESRNRDIMDEMSLFRDLLEREWKDLRETAWNVLKKKKQEKHREFALPADLAKFHSSANKKIGEFMKKTEFSKKDFVDFGKLILCRLMVFNFRRSGEMGRLEMAAYSASLGEGYDEATETGLLTESEIRKVRAGAIRVIRHFGKKGSEVATQVPLDLQEPLEKFISLREKFGGESEVYVFFHPGVGGYLRGGDALRDVIAMLGKTDFKRPESLRATNLRKFAVTHVTGSNVDGQVREWYNQHMGHSRAVSDQFYRRRTFANELRTTEIFDAIAKGENIAGKTFKKPSASHTRSPPPASPPPASPPSPASPPPPASPHPPSRPMAALSSAPSTSGVDERTPRKRKICRKLPWTPRSVEAASKAFSHIIRSKRAKLPGKEEVEEFLRKNSSDTSLPQRKWSTVKDFVRNAQKKNYGRKRSHPSSESDSDLS